GSVSDRQRDPCQRSGSRAGVDAAQSIGRRASGERRREVRSAEPAQAPRTTRGARARLCVSSVECGLSIYYRHGPAGDGRRDDRRLAFTGTRTRRTDRMSQANGVENDAVSIAPPPLQTDAIYRRMVESIGDATFMLDPRGRVQTWTAGAAGSYGYAASEII